MTLSLALKARDMNFGADGMIVKPGEFPNLRKDMKRLYIFTVSYSWFRHSEPAHAPSEETKFMVGRSTQILSDVFVRSSQGIPNNVVNDICLTAFGNRT